jgi:hypothetical protein
MRASRRCRRQSGSALVLAILILFAMLSLGLLAMRSTTQNMAGAGNLRLNKQARYVAEVGLYHAITLMQQEGAILMGLRARAVNRLQIDSTGAVRSVNGQGNEEQAVERAAPQVLAAGPAPLGPHMAADLKTSYRVTVDGFSPGPAPAGYDKEELARNGEVFCLMHFSSRGFVANADGPPGSGELQGRNAADRYAEHGLEAAVVLGPFASDACRPL